MNTVIAKKSYSSNRELSYAINVCTTGAVSHTHLGRLFGMAPAGTGNEIDRIIPYILSSPFAGHERLLLAKWHPKDEKKLRRRPFLTSLTGMKSCTVDRGCTPALKDVDATKLAVFFRFFQVFPLTFQWKTACRGDLQTSFSVAKSSAFSGLRFVDQCAGFRNAS